MREECRRFLDRCLLFDIEISERREIYALGASYRGERFLVGSKGKVDRRALQELNAFGESASFVLGHNILAHDLPKLKEVAPQLALLAKPAVDTLYLSPLAFPANPYHRLVKDYQIVRDSLNDPAQDAELAGRIFAEQWDAFIKQFGAGSEAVVFYHSFLAMDPGLAGTSASFQAMGIPRLTGDDLIESFAWFAEKYACRTAVAELQEQLYDGSIDGSLLAYVAAWLSVSGSNSVLPPWVRHRFQRIGPLLHRWREVNCKDPACGYCATHHDPHHFLQRFFGFSSFREQPATEEGTSLQQAVVEAAADNATLFATLPTGGGKSLCYLLPALMRYQRRNLLTIVISPLQALMKDQVDNFSAITGTRLATALYGMLTTVERNEVLESIRLGDAGVLYVSPEQLRNRSFIRTISQREIGAWVFDEAHCLSKWGHDFRPDYFYAVRFIREFAAREKVAIPPVQCFTATAKRDVEAEIVDTIQAELGLRVERFAGGHERHNLHYEVHHSDGFGKFQLIRELLRERYDGRGSIVCYCSTRKKTEDLAEFLQNEGYTAEPFHAGLDNALKKRLQESFIAGEIPVICATNAFGMGIDKDDVRLVIHADIPGSLENYLQEAGRAGRDRLAAECILVFSEQDIEQQFQLSAGSRLTRREIAQMLRGIRYAARGGDEAVLTAGELLRLEQVDIDPDALHDGDTRVRTGIAWLERAGFLRRNENNTKVFQGKPLVRDMAEAGEKIARLGLSRRQQERWHAIVAALMEGQRRNGFSADELAALSSFASGEEDNPNETETQRVLNTLQDMAEQGILTRETTLSAYLRHKVENAAGKRLPLVCALENDFLRVLGEEAPEAEKDVPLDLDLRQVNQKLLDLGHTFSTPESVKRILFGLGRDGKGLAGQSGSINVRNRGNNCFAISLNRDWQTIARTVEIRQQAATVALRVISAAIPKAASPSANLLVEFTLESIVNGLKGDMLLLPLLKKPLAVAERALMFLHEQGVIDLQHGLAVFSQAMTLELLPASTKRKYLAEDFLPLKTHYTERNFQIHVMNEYARQAMEKIGNGMRLVTSYFNDEKEEFINRWFPGKNGMLERATSEQSYQRIVDDLQNREQVAVVAAPCERNTLVLAGPGSGKTRAVVHRVAYLLRVKRVSAEAILVLCFNRSAVTNLRQRLRDLVGAEMNRVTTLTFHGLALRLTGRSLVTAAREQETIDFGVMIREALALLRGETASLGFMADSVRDVLTGSFSHILVDEYQDIDDDQYELVALFAGRMEKEYERRMTIMAVGDDDQNIYRFRGANVAFIRRFREDYGAQVHYLVENYRSTANIIAACNALIGRNRDRMKRDQPIRINRARETLPAGGNRQRNDPLGLGRVQLLEVESPLAQGYGLLAEIERLRQLKDGLELNSCAVLAREWQELDLVRALSEEMNIPVNLHWGRTEAFPSLSRVREHAELLDFLKENRSESLAGSTLLGLLPMTGTYDNLWQANLRRLVREWVEETRDLPQPVPLVEDFFYDAFADLRRAKNLGNGIFLSTVHSVKGLEFDHVFLLGGGWPEKSGDEEEEERRLFYVGMSRARQTLQLFHLDGVPHVHLPKEDAPWLLRRSLASEQSARQPPKLYTVLGMTELYIDYAGMRKERHPLHQVLSGLNAGDLLTARFRNGQVELVAGDVPVARLSQQGREAWAERLHEIVELRVLAMVRRRIEDVAPEYRSRYGVAQWELPIVEIVHRPSTATV